MKHLFEFRSLLVLGLFLAPAFAPLPLRAAEPVLVKDIGTGLTENASPEDLLSALGKLFFTADDGIHKRELWRSDGTAVGTTLVADIYPLAGSANPGGFTEFNGRLYFGAFDGAIQSLWKTDGTAAGTVVVKSGISVGNEPGAVHDGMLYFQGADTDGLELWKSDGTALGTEQVKDINPGTGSSQVTQLVSLNGALYFTADDGANGRELWKSDGTDAGTVMVKDIDTGGSGLNFSETIVVFDGALFFTGEDATNGEELWRSDGTAVGTDIFKDFDPGAGDGVDNDNLVVVNNTLFFPAEDPVNGNELWKTDGTLGGTVLVKDIDPGTGNSNPSDLVNVAGTLFFAAGDSVNGFELWKSSGTAASTVLVKDIYPGIEDSMNNNPFPVAVGGTVFFAADDGTNGRELWMSDGTAAGTVLVKDIVPGAEESNIDNLTESGGALFFRAEDPTTGEELWTSDGTGAGTVLVKDIHAGTVDGLSFPGGLADAAGTLVFPAEQAGTVGFELWTSDGTEAGTALLKDINPGVNGSNIDDDEVVEFGGEVFFPADDGTNGEELWKTDGTAGGTVLVKDINPGPSASSPERLVVSGGLLFFLADDGTNGKELWKTDGTEVGTELVKDIQLGSSSSFRSRDELVDAGGTLFFMVGEDELWVSDGTELGTEKLKTFSSASSPDLSDLFSSAPGNILFAADDGPNGKELWKSDGTVAGTVIEQNIHPTGSSSPSDFAAITGGIGFAADGGTDGRELWKVVGGVATQVKDINPGPDSSSPNNLFSLGSTIVFSAFEPTTGGELWTSDGTLGGTTLVKDLLVDGNSNPRDFVTAGGTTFFRGRDAEHQQELWSTDGTTLGTLLVKDFYPGPSASSPASIVLSGGKLYVVAEAPTTGRELYVFDDLDFGDAPDPTYPTLTASDGARHADVAGTLLLGALRDTEADGQPNGMATGDDLTGSADEDGVVFDSGTTFPAGGTASITVTASAAGLLNAWVDLNSDGDFDDAEEQIFTDEPLVAGANALSFDVGSDVAHAAAAARFRLDSAGGLSFDGLARDGEVEDYRVMTSDAEPPRVKRVNSVFATGDAVLTEAETTSVGITQLLVSFSEHVRDFPGDVNPDDVTNPANYLLFSDGGDGFETVDCAGGLGGTDVSVAIDSVAYDEPTRTATLSVNGGVPMFDGTYRLHVCGTTSIKDILGLTLDGDGNGTGGDDFVRNFTLLNTRPTALAGSDRTININTETILLGGMPASIGGTAPFSYQWSVTPMAGFDLGSAGAANPTFTGTALDTFTADLEVTDASGLTAMDSATIDVVCPTQLDLYNALLIGTTTFEAISVLTAELVTIGFDADVTFRAGTLVEILNGFTVEEGGVFTIELDGTIDCLP